MRTRHGEAAHLLLVVSIVGAILGMEIDIISGPLAPDSLSLVLCELETPASAGQCGRSNSWILLPARSTAVTSAPIHADDCSETSSQILDAVWPSPVAVSPVRKRTPSGCRTTLHHNHVGPIPLAHSPRPRHFAVASTPANVPVQLCRLLI